MSVFIRLIGITYFWAAHSACLAASNNHEWQMVTSSRGFVSHFYSFLFQRLHFGEMRILEARLVATRCW
uniref:Putative secreted protein n=1 Tax=Anopheles darlingi TaxID=43151 RepID=A0A2M4D8U4_ANODA